MTIVPCCIQDSYFALLFHTPLKDVKVRVVLKFQIPILAPEQD